ncbi:MAG: ParA family protein [Cellvibrionaceae bacterium]|nr:ParA family protein [Cellvibrionaceae bacterium]
MQILTVANQKGGVGKTTTSVTLGGIAAAEGQRVLLVDLDPHGSLSCYFGKDPDRLTESVYRIFEQRKTLSRALVQQYILPTAYKNMALLPASTALATLERQAIGDGMGLVLHRSLLFLQQQFDLVVIDCPPQLGVLMVNAIAACSQLIIPVQTEFLAIKGLERILHTLTMMNKTRARPLQYLIVPTLYDRRTQASVTSLRTIRNNYGDYVWPGKIPIDTRLRDASKAGVPPHLFDDTTRGFQAYQSLYRSVDQAPLTAACNIGGA